MRPVFFSGVSRAIVVGLSLSAALLGFARGALGAGEAQQIIFDEFPAGNGVTEGFPGNRYANLGVTFELSDDGGTWAGLGGGDPGNWGIAGTNGSIFSGFNGTSYGGRMLYGAAVFDFRLDVARSNGSQIGDTFRLQGFLAGNLVDSELVTLGSINSWQTVVLGGVIDEVRWEGIGNDSHPFGVDNIQWITPEPAGTFLIMLLGAAGLVTRNRM